MSGIQIHTSSPITAAKPSGTTPQTVAPEGQAVSAAPTSNLATPTTTAPSSSTSQTSYRPAAPGQAPTPAPTSSAPRPAQHPIATPTTTSTPSSHGGPPAPQPGPTPSPFTRTYGANTSLPPPPKAGEKPQPAAYYTPARSPAPTHRVPLQSYPPQSSIPPPASQSFGQPPGSTTGTTNVPSYPYSNLNPYGPQFQAHPPPTHTTPLGVQGAGGDPRRPSFEHPPGYVQNPYASGQQYNQRNETPSYGYNGISSASHNGGHDGAELSMWDTAKSWAKSAGEKASQVESDIWRRINKG